MSVYQKTFNLGSGPIGEARIAAWTKAAGDISLTEWVRQVCDDAAGFDETKVKKGKVK